MNSTRHIALLGLVATAVLRLGAIAEAQPPTVPQPAVVNPLFEPDPLLVESAIKIGKESVKRKMTVGRMLKRWSNRVPDADGYAVALVPAALVAVSAFDAQKFHKDAEAEQKQISAAVQRGREHLAFQVVLRSKGSGTWLWPRGMKPGDRQALEAIKYVLGDDQGHFYQPLDPEAQKQISSENKALGLPFGINTYVPIGSWFLSLPFSLGGTRQDFEARYEPTFPLKDAKGNPIFNSTHQKFSLRVIGATDEKSVEFSIADLIEKSRG